MRERNVNPEVNQVRPPENMHHYSFDKSLYLMAYFGITIALKQEKYLDNEYS